ncbi:MAG: hypothetical protein FJY75_08150 [Candidatus Eisenbacteria bacterium]|uniref:Uncharacterized protein n=1 Tax=Eiseniibacteriota bacterium TaxID=2212470 RepID=A0A937XBE4_UNCEI|nr:hypothetical protein [Candidatus Eisenbacteria bacterium]
MDPVAQLRLALAQTPALEALQEGARRRDDRQQAQVERVFRDRVELQGRQVEECPPPEAVGHDPDEGGAGRGRPGPTPAERAPEEAAEEGTPEAADALGARLDKRA